jgi:hypothetical protein
VFMPPEVHLVYTDDSHFEPSYADTITLARSLDPPAHDGPSLRARIQAQRHTARPVTLSAHAVDVWGCGVLLYEMLFARTTFLLPDEPGTNYDVHNGESFRKNESALWRLVLDPDGGIARTRNDVLRRQDGDSI